MTPGICIERLWGNEVPINVRLVQVGGRMKYPDNLSPETDFHFVVGTAVGADVTTKIGEESHRDVLNKNGERMEFAGVDADGKEVAVLVEPISILEYESLVRQGVGETE